jgi:hypothetical protein
MSTHLAVAPIGGWVRITHDGHPYDGQAVQVLARDHGIGGAGGGGVVDIGVDGQAHPVSRYTRCVLLDGEPTHACPDCGDTAGEGRSDCP